MDARIARFVGLPFADHGRDASGSDCYGGCRMVLRELCGLVLPDYGAGYTDTGDCDGIGVAIRDGLVADFGRVERPAPFDLVIFNLAGKPWHVGLVVSATQFLHWPQPTKEGTAGTSRIERFTERMWRNRVEGYYRHKSTMGESQCA